MADTIIMRPTDKNWLPSVKNVIQAGGLVALPTDTVYGLACDPFNDSAIQRLYRAKKRTSEKAIPILLSNLVDLDKVAVNVSSEVLNLGKAFWPGPLTIVLERHPDLPDSISPEPTIGVRIPAHPIALEILKACGPLAVSSANTSGGLDATTPQEVLVQLTGRIHLLIDGGPSLGNKPSTVMDGTRKIVRILREGPISMGDILESQKGTD
jgi:L-threonylcarbamoyladenylate synthase